MNKRVTTNIYLDPRYKLDNGTYAVKLRITFKGNRDYVSLNHWLSEDDFDKVMGDGPRGKYRKIREELNDSKLDADNIIKDMKKFSIDKFKHDYLTPSAPNNDIFALFGSYISEVRSEGRIGSADSYNNAKVSIEKFVGKNFLPFEKVTVKFLRKYETWMIEKDRSIGTVGAYLRALRIIVNIAHEKNLIDENPFGKGRGKYHIKKALARKAALNASQLKAIFEYKPEDRSSEQYHLDLWKFSYLCSGMNLNDICLLKWDNLIGDIILFRRSKTERSDLSGIGIVIDRNKNIDEIIERWGNLSKEKSDFLFPVLNNKMTPEKRKATVKQLTKQINKYIKRVSKNLEIMENVSFITARHSYASHIRNKGAEREFISEQLGHRNIQTTDAYLASFEDKVRKEWQSKATDFDL